MNYKYNILWLDDEPIKALEQISEVNPSIYFDKVDYVDICKMKLESQPEKYHAVILDANGVSSDSPEKDANKSGFLSLVHSVIENHLPLYIYSGQILRAADGDPSDIVLEQLYILGLKDNIFYKSGGPYDLVDKIVKDLNNKYLYYKGNEYFLSIFSNGWIPKGYKSQFLDPIMENYFNKNYDYAYGNNMRHITELMLDKINTEYNLETNYKKSDSSYYKKIAEAIKWKKLDYSELIIGPLFHLIELANATSHDEVPEECRKLYFDSDYSTFFIVANWFHKMMKLGANSQDRQIDKKSKPQTHEDRRTGVPVPTYKDNNGRTYCDLKIEIPKRYKDCTEIIITGVKPNPDFSINKGNNKWILYCQEPNNSNQYHK